MTLKKNSLFLNGETANGTDRTRNLQNWDGDALVTERCHESGRAYKRNILLLLWNAITTKSSEFTSINNFFKFEFKNSKQKPHNIKSTRNILIIRSNSKISLTSYYQLTNCTFTEQLTIWYQLWTVSHFGIGVVNNRVSWTITAWWHHVSKTKVIAPKVCSSRQGTGETTLKE